MLLRRPKRGVNVAGDGRRDLSGYDAEGANTEFSGTRWYGELSLYTEGSLHQSAPKASRQCVKLKHSSVQLAAFAKVHAGSFKLCGDFYIDWPGPC